MILKLKDGDVKIQLFEEKGSLITLKELSKLSRRR